MKNNSKEEIVKYRLFKKSQLNKYINLIEDQFKKGIYDLKEIQEILNVQHPNILNGLFKDSKLILLL